MSQSITPRTSRLDPMGATHILIIEDDPDTASILKMFFSKEGYTVELAADGEEGLKVLSERRHALVISDVMMPKMDGFAFCERVRKDPDLKMTPIVLVTAKNELSDKIIGLEKGADDYLIKPYNLLELKVRVATMLKLRGLRSELTQKEKELERVKTLEQTLIAISHHINNATAPISGRAQICRPDDPESVQKLISACTEGCTKITGTIELLSKLLQSMKDTDNGDAFHLLNTSINDLITQFESREKL